MNDFSESLVARKFNSIHIFFILIMIFGLLAICFQVNGYRFWRHDILGYIGSYDHKFRTEGRWLNWLLFPVLRKIPPLFAWYVALGLNFIFFARFAFNVSLNKIFAVYFGLICIFSPSFFSLLNWPIITLPGLIILNLSFLLCRYFSFIFVFPVISILIFGTHPQFIYLLPLTCLTRSFFNEERIFRNFSVLMLVWAGSFVLGYLFAEFFTYLKFGNFIELSDWRDPNPATNFRELNTNINKNFNVLFNQLILMFPLLWVLLSCYFLFVFYAAFKKFKSPLSQNNLDSLLIMSLLAVSIGIAHYICAAPSGVRISIRTVYSLYVAVLVIAICYVLFLDKIASAILVFALLVLPAIFISYKSVEWYSTTTQIMYNDLQTSLNDRVSQDAKIVIDLTNYENYINSLNLPEQPYKIFEGLTAPMRWKLALVELGYNSATLCEAASEDDMCREVRELAQSNCPAEGEKICLAGEIDDVFVISLGSVDEN